MKRNPINVNCGKTFNSPKTIQIHERIHRGKKSYECNLCGKAFNYFSAFQSQKRHHMYVKHVLKFWVVPAHLKNHERIYTGEKPYKCKECGKAFTLNITLWIHMITHTGAGPYKCEKVFMNPSSLKIHESSHTGERPYQCHKMFSEFMKVQ